MIFSNRVNLIAVKFKDHIPPTLHNAIGTLIAAAILSAIGLLFKPARDWVVFCALLLIPLWIALVFIGIIVAIHIFVTKHLRAEVARIKEELAETKAHLNKAEAEKLERDLADKRRAAQQPRQKIIVGNRFWRERF